MEEGGRQAATQLVAAEVELGEEGGLPEGCRHGPREVVVRKIHAPQVAQAAHVGRKGAAQAVKG